MLTSIECLQFTFGFNSCILSYFILFFMAWPKSTLLNGDLRGGGLVGVGRLFA